MTKPVRGMLVGIVGAGITGLALSHYLHREGVESVVLEAHGRPGGVIESDRVEGRVLDYGPQRTRLTPGVRELVDSLDLREGIIEAPDLPPYVFHGDRLRRVPRTVREAITTDLLSRRGKLRALLEPARGLPRPGESVEGYLTRALGGEVARRLGGPLYAGLYASDPAEMPVEHSLARALDRLGVGKSVLLAALRSRLRRRDPPPLVSFEDGMETLPRALYHRYRDAVRLETPAVELRSLEEGFLITTRGDGLAVDAVVLTVPAYASATLLGGIDEASARRLETLTYNPLAVVHVEADATLDGAGYQVSLEEDLITRGVTFNDALFDRDGVYTCYLGGATRPDVVEWSPDRLGDVATREFERVTGRSAGVLSVRRRPRAMPAYDATWDALAGVSLPGGVYLCANYESRAGIPGRIRAAKRLAKSLSDGVAITGTQ